MLQPTPMRLSIPGQKDLRQDVNIITELENAEVDEAYDGRRDLHPLPLR